MGENDRECPFRVQHNTVVVKVRGEWRVVCICHGQATAALVAIALDRMGCTEIDFEHYPDRTTEQ